MEQAIVEILKLGAVGVAIILVWMFLGYMRQELKDAREERKSVGVDMVTELTAARAERKEMRARLDSVEERFSVFATDVVNKNTEALREVVDAIRRCNSKGGS